MISSHKLKILLVVYVPGCYFIVFWKFLKELHLHALCFFLVLAHSHKGLGVGWAGTLWILHFVSWFEAGCSELGLVVSMRAQSFSVFAKSFIEVLFAKTFGDYILCVLWWFLGGHSLFFGLVVVNDCFLYFKSSWFFGLGDYYSFENLCFEWILIVLSSGSLSWGWLESTFAFISFGHESYSEKRALCGSWFAFGESFPFDLEESGS